MVASQEVIILDDSESEHEPSGSSSSSSSSSSHQSTQNANDSTALYASSTGAGAGAGHSTLRSDVSMSTSGVAHAAASGSVGAAERRSLLSVCGVRPHAQPVAASKRKNSLQTAAPNASKRSKSNGELSTGQPTRQPTCISLLSSDEESGDGQQEAICSDSESETEWRTPTSGRPKDADAAVPLASTPSANGFAHHHQLKTDPSTNRSPDRVEHHVIQEESSFAEEVVSISSSDRVISNGQRDHLDDGTTEQEEASTVSLENSSVDDEDVVFSEVRLLSNGAIKLENGDSLINHHGQSIRSVGLGANKESVKMRGSGAGTAVKQSSKKRKHSDKEREHRSRSSHRDARRKIHCQSLQESFASAAQRAALNLVTDNQPRVVNGTSYRRLALEEPPCAIVSMREYPCQPMFTSNTTGELKEKCAFNGFSSSEERKPNQFATVEEAQQRVHELVELFLPKIQAMHRDRNASILREARERVGVYRQAAEAQRQVILSKKLNHRIIAVDDSEKDDLRAIFKRAREQRMVRKPKAEFELMNDHSDKNKVKKKTVPLALLGTHRTLSKSKCVVSINSSVREEDDPILRFVPYFNDQDEGETIRLEQYEGMKKTAANACIAMDEEVKNLMTCLVVRELGEEDKVFDAIYSEFSAKNDEEQAEAEEYWEEYYYQEEQKKKAETKNKYKKIKEESAEQEKTRKHFEVIQQFKQHCGELASDSAPGGEHQRSLSTELCEPGYIQDSLRRLLKGANLWHLDKRVTERSFNELLEPVLGALSEFESNYMRWSKAMGLHDDVSDYGGLVKNYRDLFCRRCYHYDCQIHGIEHPFPKKRNDPVHPVLRLAPKDESSACVEASPCHEQENVNSVKSQESEDGASPKEDTTETDSASVSLPTTPAETVPTDAVRPNAVHKKPPGVRRRSRRSLTQVSTRATEHMEMQEEAELAAPVRRQHPVVPHTFTKHHNLEYIDLSWKPLVAEHMKRLNNESGSCGLSCWKLVDPRSGADAVNSEKYQFSSSERLLLEKLLDLCEGNCCLMVTMLQPSRLTCALVYEHFVSGQLAALRARQNAQAKKKRSCQHHKKDNRLSSVYRKMLAMVDQGIGIEFIPCDHDGPCKSSREDCSCRERNHFCEKGCACPPDCPFRFPGCKCSRGNCRTKQCTCFIAARECDPNLCHSCGASEVACLHAMDPETKQEHLAKGTICGNVNLQLGLHKRIAMSFSRTHGWGAFALEPIKKNDFIYEYTGEMISQEEAERRGSIYDHIAMSFLFDLNQDAVLDALRKGNKSRFINHQTVAPNCKAKVPRLSGDHRIGIYALQDIAEGEELFFDYGYSGQSAPKWSQIRARGGGNK